MAKRNKTKSPLNDCETFQEIYSFNSAPPSIPQTMKQFAFVSFLFIYLFIWIVIAGACETTFM